MCHRGAVRTAFVLSLIWFCSCSTDIITSNQPLRDGDLLISQGKIFALGFFSPGNSSTRYVGIWYNQVPEQTVVWVANRDDPINGTSGVLSIDGIKNLVLYDEKNKNSVWSTNISGISRANSSYAQLLDSGNLVLFQDQGTSAISWQSFDHPTNTLLPAMKLGVDKRAGFNRFLTSWESNNDPATGKYRFKVDLNGTPQLFLYKGSEELWRGGPWNGVGWTGVPEMTPHFIFTVSYIDNDDETIVVYTVRDPTIFSRLVLNESGVAERWTWQESEQRWAKFWFAPKEPCDYYAHCGSFANCNPLNLSEFECSCLPGFEPKLPRQWYLRDGSNGCLRKQGESTCGNGEGFMKFTNAKIPDTSVARMNKNLGLRACESLCLKDCSCSAYASANVSEGGSGCIIWSGELIDLREFPQGGQDIYIRVPKGDLVKLSHKNRSPGKTVVVIATLCSLFVVLLLSLVASYLVKKKRIEKEGQSASLLPFDGNFRAYEGSSSGKAADATKADIWIFDLRVIVSATDNFTPDNKLGEGGFGSVYKGKLPDGQEIAVKRLSQTSGQGIQEFKNEVTLIARLQHRNLVRLLGCCIQKDEKMLVYEYMPNKGLDAFIFDKVKGSLIDWGKRLEIILGIARGMLYLHQDSRLRIIHRDLKASNILLDDDMNPKISDFGMARIFGGDQLEANTNRVVGTYGYMSPEYAMGGHFSAKSDVFSFGVLLLEIISGMKNNHNFQDSDLNLIGHVWNLWKEGRALDIVDPSLGESYDPQEVQRCIHISLLSVQEIPNDRPTMPDVIIMLCNETTLPFPNQPAFIFRDTKNNKCSSSASVGARSVNDMSITLVEGR